MPLFLIVSIHCHIYAGQTECLYRIDCNTNPLRHILLLLRRKTPQHIVHLASPGKIVAYTETQAGISGSA